MTTRFVLGTLMGLGVCFSSGPPALAAQSFDAGRAIPLSPEPRVPGLQPQGIDCLIEPHEVADVSVAVDGIVDTVEVRRGDRVKRGQVLATLESSVEKATVKLARARAEARHLIRARRARAEYTGRRLERHKELFKKKAISYQDVDEAEVESILAQMEFEQAVEERRIAKLELERAQKLLALRTIRSPVDGVVVKLFITPGESVEDRPIVQIAQVDPLNVEAIAPVRLHGTVKRGMWAEVRPEDPIGGVHKAQVSIVDPVIDAPSGTFGVRLELPNSQYTLPAGLRCRVYFQTEDGEG